MSETTQGLLKNRYELHEVIGRGGMATVYRAVDTALGREVAIKIFAATDDDIEGAKQEDEVNVLASFNHHSLVTLLDAGVDRSDRDNPRVFLVMELVLGPDLQRAIAAGGLVSRQVSQIGYDLAEGLQYIHRRGVVHRDIKPSNILLADYQDDGTRARAKLTDFGIAHRGVQQQRAGDATTTGTAAYLSPEQVRRDEVGPATDIYALGLVLIECFTGTLAYPGDPVDSAMRRLVDNPALPEELANEWKILLSAMTAREPAKRPVASELVLAMRDLVMLETGRHRTKPTVAEPSDATPGEAFERMTSLAARVLGTPIAIINVDNSDRVWFRSNVAQIDSEPGLVAATVLPNAAWIVGEAGVDPRALVNPLVATEFGLHFYLATPLTTSEGDTIGTLCVLDFAPRTASADDVATMTDLAVLVTNELELRQSARRGTAHQLR